MVLPASAPAGSVIDANVAPLYVGQEAIVEGVVTAAVRDGYVVRLSLGDGPQPLRVQLVLGMLSRFPAQPENYYLGKTVRVAGKITEFRGQAEIVVREPHNIALSSELPPEPVDSTAEVNSLNERVRELEERIRQLENAQLGGRMVEEPAGDPDADKMADETVVEPPN